MMNEKKFLFITYKYYTYIYKKKCVYFKIRGKTTINN